jgi:hypothetical protein
MQSFGVLRGKSRKLLVVLFLSLVLSCFIAVVSTLGVTAWRVARLTEIAEAAQPGLTTFESFRETVAYRGRGELQCPTGDCKFYFEFRNRFASLIKLASPTVVSYTIEFKHFVVSSRKMVFSVGDFGESALVYVDDTVERLNNCDVSPCASLISSPRGVRVRFDLDSPSDLRNEAMKVNTSCFWRRSGCERLEEAYPAALLYRELGRRHSIQFE